MRSRSVIAFLATLLALSACGLLTPSPTPQARTSPHPTESAIPVKSATPPPGQVTPGPGASPVRIEQPLPGSPGECVASDVLYCPVRPGSSPHLTSLDVYAPSSARDLPVVVYVHGGGWVGGDHAPVGAKADYFTARGFLLVSVNYRLAPDVRPAEQAQDLAAAVGWVRERIGAYGGNADELFMLGHSAGAHLIALIATDESVLRAVGQDLAAIRGIILLDSAAYDVEQLMRSPDGQLDVYRSAFGTDPSAWAALSPRAHVAPGKGIPPTLLMLATAAGQRRPAAEGMAAALRAAGVYAQIADASSFSDHETIDAALGNSDDTPTAAVQSFLDMLLTGAPTGMGGKQVLRPGP